MGEMKIFLTGGAGFIGSALVRHLIANTDHELLVFDKLTYAGNLESIQSVAHSDRLTFVRGDICDAELVRQTLASFMPQSVMHLAAESHVDRSIGSASSFIETNITGTFVLLEAARVYRDSLSAPLGENFRFHHISTDEVFGDLGPNDPAFTEEHAYQPSSPYSASKAASDHLVRAWHRTHGLPILITNCSNNYGPYHHPEKLIPKCITNALQGKSIPVYGNGQQIRDWLYVEDHVKALCCVLENGEIGETYNIGGLSERSNIEVVNLICELLQERAKTLTDFAKIKDYKSLIVFVNDRPGHDLRYAIDTHKISRELAWKPQEDFKSGMLKTIDWFLQNRDWWEKLIRKNSY